MPNYRKMARQAAVRRGLDPDIFERQIQQESGFRPRVSSGAGAQGIAQIMPATARAWGVNPNDPKAALNAAAKNMASYVRKYGGYENALRAYNAGPGAIQRSKGFSETNHYVATILRGKDPKRLGRASGGGGGGGGSATASSTTPLRAKFDPGDTSSALSSLVSELSSSRQAPSVTAPAPPAHAAGPTTPTGYGDLSSSGTGASEHSQVSDALSRLAELQPAQGGISTATSGGKTVSSTNRWGGKGGKSVVEVGGGKVDLRPRGGYKGTNGPVADFSRLGQALGLSVTSSKRNNSNPYSGSRSDHDFGNKDATARDMSNGGSPTPQMDRYAKEVADALGIAYKKGTPVNKTKTVNGVRYQLIYRGDGAAFGGNHMNHVHLGAKRVGKGGGARGVLR